MNSDIELKISYRFLSLNSEQAKILKTNIKNIKFGTHFKTKHITASIPLKHNIPKISAFIKEHEILKEETDIFISFVTEYDTRIIDIPNYVSEATKELGAKMVLSYTII